MKYVLTFLIAFVFLKVQAQYPAVTISRSEVRKIMSKIVAGQEYELQIMLPASYANSNKKYPVVYLMDSQWDFPLVTAIYGQQYYDGFIPELIIVGVTWSGEHANADSLRVRDYSPTKVEAMPQSGGADRFLAFMKQELFPFIESNYKAEGSNRTLMGCSGGAVFTLYTMLTHPDLFAGYAAATPYIPWDNDVLYKYERAFANKRLTNPLRMYMTVGDVEMTRAAFERFTDTMVAHKYPSVQLRLKILENTGHSGTKNETYARGLQFIFERPKVNVAATVLNKYVGTYQLEDGRSIDFRNENGQLVLYFGDSRMFDLYASDENDFYAIGQFFNVHFDSAPGKPTGFLLETYGNKQFAKRVK